MDRPSKRSGRTHYLRTSLIAGVMLSALMGGCGGGCGSPNKANIQLRKEKQDLQDQVEQLKNELGAANARIQGMERADGALATLPQDRLDGMFTVHGIRLGRLTGGGDLDPYRPGDEGVRVYLTPVDEAGDAVKATGQLVVEAYALGGSDPQRLGRWEFGPAELKKHWRSLGLVQGFVVSGPWQTVPTQPEITLRVQFEDALTGRRYSMAQEASVKLPPAVGATTRPQGQ